jgi:hypothetical protein
MATSATPSFETYRFAILLRMRAEERGFVGRALNADVEIGAEAVVGSGGKLRTVLLRRFEKLRDSRLRIRIHAHHLRRDGELNLRGLGANESGSERADVHAGTLSAEISMAA